MAGVTVSIAPEILNWIIEKVQLGNSNHPVFDLLNKWKTGEKVPTFNQVQEVSGKPIFHLAISFWKNHPLKTAGLWNTAPLTVLPYRNPAAI